MPTVNKRRRRNVTNTHATNRFSTGSRLTRARASFILRLPDEVILQVFEELVCGSNFSEYPLVVLLRTSHALGAVARNPILWTRINVTGSSEEVGVYLKRSGKCLISFVAPEPQLEGLEGHELDEQIPQMLKQHMHRVKAVTLFLERHALDKMMAAIWNEPAPQLRVLSLHCHPTLELCSFGSGRAFAGNIPRLKTLTLDGVNFDSPSRHFPHVLHLTLDAQQPHFLSLSNGSVDHIRACPGLKRLALTLLDNRCNGWDFETMFAASNASADLRHLETLDITCYNASNLKWLLSRLEFPLGCDVTICLVGSVPNELGLAGIVPQDSSLANAISEARSLLIRIGPRAIILEAGDGGESGNTVHLVFGRNHVSSAPEIVSQFGTHLPLPRALALSCFLPRGDGESPLTMKSDWAKCFAGMPALRTLALIRNGESSSTRNTCQLTKFKDSFANAIHGIVEPAVTTTAEDASEGSSSAPPSSRVLPQLETLYLGGLDGTVQNLRYLKKVLKTRMEAGCHRLDTLTVRDATGHGTAEDFGRWSGLLPFAECLDVDNTSSFPSLFGESDSD